MLLLPLFLVLLGVAAGLVMMNLNLQKRTMSGQDSPLNGEKDGQKEAEFTTDVEKPAPTATPAPTPEPTPEPVFVYTIPENALSGMEPDPEGYHESMEAAELAAFLQREEVQTLVDGRKLVWNADIERYPETPASSGRKWKPRRWAPSQR